MRDHATADYTETCANGMPDDTARYHSPQVLARRQDDRGDLRSIAPLRHERHRECLHEDPQQHFECTGFGFLRTTHLGIGRDVLTALLVHLFLRWRKSTKINRFPSRRVRDVIGPTDFSLYFLLNFFSWQRKSNETKPKRKEIESLNRKVTLSLSELLLCVASMNPSTKKNSTVD